MNADVDPDSEILRAALEAGDWPVALPILLDLARQNAGEPRHWTNLAVAQRAMGAKSSRALKRALILNPATAGNLNDLGAVDPEARVAEWLLVLDPLHGPAAVLAALRAFGSNRRPRAVRTLRRLRLAEPSSLDATFLLGQFLDLAGRKEEAIRLYRSSLHIDPEDTMGARRDLARHGVTPIREAFSSTYVAKVFDNYAEKFDAHLTDRLNYSGPETLRRLGVELGILSEGRNIPRAVDIGCGTGLSGAAFRPHCNHLSGIDIAKEMVRRAEEKAIYDRLTVGHAVEVLSREDEVYDLAIAADVSAYIGDLGPLFTSISNRLAPGGTLLMTAHELTGPDENGIGIGRDGVHCHSAGYLRDTAEHAGLSLTELRQGSMRDEGDMPLATLFLAFTKLRQSRV
ncbi:methyltransferase domain-containing protein [Nisaea acidiphila]|uniref:Methyltransferase domain-containing protein n=1 Tax=Nisaea acidiphila TaxID=1862145 RepID=A0A9J7AL30_9PROT|nr:methyltransferase [Nisaea acidiphila]UUX48363.1 methyltransferase domain-containing protein [Nisaea acidiphila]